VRVLPRRKKGALVINWEKFKISTTFYIKHGDFKRKVLSVFLTREEKRLYMNWSHPTRQ